MRAEWNRKCDVYLGPPWEEDTLRIAVGIDCRFVEATQIIATTPPLNQVVGWVTMDFTPPAAAEVTQGDGFLMIDYSTASRIVLTGDSPLTLYVLFVERVFPDQGRDYSRALVTNYPLTDGA